MDDWRSYDGVATTYEQVHAPRFVEPARDLVALARVTSGERLLDVGTGTGVVAEVADALGADVIGIDPSIGMLTVAREHRPAIPVVAAEAIDLPFRDATFDVVTAGFVLAHFARPETALFDLRRVLRRGGRFAASAWADGNDAFTDTWRELIGSIVPPEMLQPSLAGAIPNHERFRRADVVAETFSEAGLRKVRVERAHYEWVYTQEEFLSGLETWATARFARGMIGEAGWESFRARARQTFADRFPDPLHDRRDVLLVAGERED
jgi:ubiquinone/menaquinone biosynthesis C-methylase UbiE